MFIYHLIYCTYIGLEGTPKNGYSNFPSFGEETTNGTTDVRTEWQIIYL